MEGYWPISCIILQSEQALLSATANCFWIHKQEQLWPSTSETTCESAEGVASTANISHATTAADVAANKRKPPPKRSMAWKTLKSPALRNSYIYKRSTAEMQP